MGRPAPSRYDARMSTPLRDVVRFLDEHLRINEISDDANALNGLQVEAATEVTRVACAVDAGEPSIEEACLRGADLLVVHHGLLWGGHRPITGPHARKLKRCFMAGLSVYAAHLPLDIHLEVGNNAGILRALGLTADGGFGKYHGIEIGMTAPCDLTLEELAAQVRTKVGECRLAGKGPARIRRLGVASGSGGSLVASAARSGLDALLTGEGPHHAALDAEERGLHLLLAGHYRTETFGPKAVGALLAKAFAVPWSFIEHDTGL